MPVCFMYRYYIHALTHRLILFVDLVTQCIGQEPDVKPKLLWPGWLTMPHRAEINWVNITEHNTYPTNQPCVFGQGTYSPWQYSLPEQSPTYNCIYWRVNWILSNEFVHVESHLCCLILHSAASGKRYQYRNQALSAGNTGYLYQPFYT